MLDVALKAIPATGDESICESRAARAGAVFVVPRGAVLAVFEPVLPEKVGGSMPRPRAVLVASIGAVIIGVAIFRPYVLGLLWQN